MAIRTEFYTIDEKEFVRTYSDANRYVVRDGVSYSEACDPVECGRTYTEGELITDGESGSDIEEIINILLGTK